MRCPYHRHACKRPCSGICSAASSTTTATSACAGALAADLGSRGETVRLWVDDASALAWMAPQGARRRTAWLARGGRRARPGDVVEAFGCDPPASFVVAHGHARIRAPVWINLEYLSASPTSRAATACPRRSATASSSGSSIRASTRAVAGCCASAICSRSGEAFDAQVWLAVRWASLEPRRRARREPVLLRQPGVPALLGQLAACRRCCSPRPATRATGARGARRLASR